MRNSVIILLAAVFFSCSQNQGEQRLSGDSANPVVRTVHPVERVHQPSYTYTATIKPWREANLGTSVPGRVEKIYFKEGATVTEGALIARLSAEPEIMARVEKETLENDYNRVKRLRERGSVTQQDFDHVEAQYKAASAKHEMMVKNTQIRAPFAGTIMEILVQEGETFFFMPAIQPGSSFSPGIVRLMQLNPLLAEFHIPEKELSLLKGAVEVTLRADALPDQTFSATLHKTAAMVSPGNRTLAAEVKIADPGRELLVGMYARVNVLMPARQHLFVPNHAVEENEEGYFVWTIDKEGRAVSKTVHRLFMDKGEAAVEGLEATDRVVTAGRGLLTEGVVVRNVQ